jgi:hypothetical protein
MSKAIPVRRSNFCGFRRFWRVNSGNSGTVSARWQDLLQVEMTGSPRGSIQVDEASSFQDPIEDGKRQELVSEEVREITWNAQHRLHMRYRKLTARGKDKGKVVTAIGRELLGFVWAIGVKVEAAQKETERRAA